MGGGLFDLSRNMKEQYAWGLGRSTNDVAKFVALFQGLKILSQKDISEVIIIGESQILIKFLIHGPPPNELMFARLHVRILEMLKTLREVNFFHVLWENNREANTMDSGNPSLKTASTIPSPVYF